MLLLFAQALPRLLSPAVRNPRMTLFKNRRSAQPIERPASRRAQTFVCRFGPLFQPRHEPLQTAVAHCDGHVAPEPLKSRSAHRRAVEFFLERRFVHRRQPIQSRIHQLRRAPPAPDPRLRTLCGSRGKRPGRCRSRRPACPCPAINSGAIGPLVLDGQVGNAPRRIHLMRRNQRAGGASLQTPAAASAATGRRQRRFFLFCLKRSKQHRQKAKRTKLRMDQAGVLSLPTQPRRCGQFPLDQRPSVNEGARLELA